jgi:CPA1 family monovalent cation:H+ antiporter
LVVSAVVIVSRFVWMFPATYLPRWLVPSIARRDPAPPWQWAFILGYTGIRGVVSLAAALALPLTTDDGLAFPHRGLILFLTFSVILVTLVGQGVLLPGVIRALGLANAGRRELEAELADEFAARRKAIEAAARRLEALRVERNLPDAVLDPLHSFHADRLRHLDYGSSDHPEHRRVVAIHREVAALLLAAERDAINELYRAGNLRDEPRRRIERDLDLRDAQISNAPTI